MANRQENNVSGGHKTPEQKLMAAVTTVCQEQDQKFAREAPQPQQVQSAAQAPSTSRSR